MPLTNSAEALPPAPESGTGEDHLRALFPAEKGNMGEEPPLRGVGWFHIPKKRLTTFQNKTFWMFFFLFFWRSALYVLLDGIFLKIALRVNQRFLSFFCEIFDVQQAVGAFVCFWYQGGCEGFPHGIQMAKHKDLGNPCLVFILIFLILFFLLLLYLLLATRNKQEKTSLLSNWGSSHQPLFFAHAKICKQCSFVEIILVENTSILKHWSEYKRMSMILCDSNLKQCFFQ